MRAHVSLILIFVTILTGCRNWYAQPEVSTLTGNELPRMRIAPDAVVLEVAVAKMSNGCLSDFEEVWGEADSSPLSLDHRMALDRNGIRATVFSSNLPAKFQELLEPDAIEPDKLSGLQKQLFKKGLLKPEPRYLLHDGIQNRDGQAHPVPVSGVLSSASWVVHGAAGQSAGASEHVRGIIEIKTFPQGDGTVRLECVPCLQLGAPRLQIGVQRHGFVYETGATKKFLRDLEFDLKLKAGETMVIAPTKDRGDLGGVFFGTPPNLSESIVAETLPEESDGSFRILLVRVLQTQMDDLFRPTEVKEELTTTSLD